MAFFIINKNWKKHKCPSTGEWINKLPYSHTIGYYSAINGNRLLIDTRMWMNLKNIILKWKNLDSKCMIPFIWHPGKDQNNRDNKQILLVEDRRWLQKDTREILGLMKLLYINFGGGYMTRYICHNSNCNLKKLVLICVYYSLINNKNIGNYHFR